MVEAQIGVIGGSGLYEMEGLSNVRAVRPQTPFGLPSDVITLGRLEGVDVAFLPRHGLGHRLNPGEIPVRANIFALKSLGVEQIISVSAVGSLQEEIRPLDMVVPNQLIDRTRGRLHSFFDDGIVAHISFADPFCPVLSDLVVTMSKETGATVHQGKTYLVMEGPAFSTRAESNLYRSWGADVIGMTAIPEAKLAREAEICYVLLACATDYDVWHAETADVSVEDVVFNLGLNVETSREILRRTLSRLPDKRTCSCSTALENSIITAPEQITASARKRLDLLVGRYLH
jgi:5'-methylthioadenosine phosphorylase